MLAESVRFGMYGDGTIGAMEEENPIAGILLTDEKEPNPIVTMSETAITLPCRYWLDWSRRRE